MDPLNLLRDITLNALSSEFSKDSLWFPLIHLELTMDFLHIHYLFREFTMNLLSITLIHLEFIIFYANSLSFSRIHYDLTFLFAISIWIHQLFLEFRLDSLSFPRIDYEFTIFFRELTVNSLSFSRFTMDPLSFSPIHYEFTINYINPPWIHYLFRKFNFFFENSLWFNFSFCGKNIGIQNWFLICSANSLLSFLRIHHPCREFIMISFSWYQYGSINFFVNSELIHYFFREFTFDP